MRPRSTSAIATAWLATSALVHVAAAAWLARPHVPPDAADAPAREQLLAGETFELPSTLDAVEPREAFEPREAPAAEADDPPASVGATAPPRPARRAPARAGAAAAGGAADAPLALFGAVGDRSALDLATLFTRSFPIAASDDAQWARVPFGSAGAADVTFVLDASGALKDARVAEGASPALAAGVRRTLALIRGRALLARGATTRLHVRAVVSPDEKHDGLHGNVFAVGAGFQGREGTAFFALSIGRRVDVHVTERR